MSNLIKNISVHIKQDVVIFNQTFKDNLKSDVKIINYVINYISKKKGKQFRALICLLCSRLTLKNPNHLTFLSASAVEILHVATLLHDDVVDDAKIRRGWPTINKIWKNKLSILIGDYMFSKALVNIAKIDDFKCINILADISKRLSEGEISQIEHAITKNMSEEEYFKMITNKTASLISASCYLGLYSNEKDEKLCQSVFKFGEYLGVAYQLKDDIFDILGNINNTGKSSHLDIKKNMMTLPYIHVLSKLNKKEKRNFLIEIRKLTYRSDFQRIKDIIIKHEGIKYSKGKDKKNFQL